MVSAPDTLVGEMTIIRAMSRHNKELWMAEASTVHRQFKNSASAMLVK